MRVAIHGSARGIDKKKRGAFRRFCEAMGAELTRRGHVVLVHGDEDWTADRILFGGVRRFAGKSGIRPKVEVHRARDVAPMKFEKAPFAVCLVPYPKDADLTKSPDSDRPLGPRVGKIASADVVLLVGGKKESRRSAAFADQLDKPVLAVPWFGGVAMDLFLNRYESKYQDNERIKNRLGELTHPAGKFPDVRRIVWLCQTLSGLHTYFISYKRGADAAWADRLELLLLREERKVRRDERDLQLGDDIKAELEERIATSDTYVGLWSRQFADSKYCRWELEKAGQLRHQNRRLRRAILIRIDDTEFEDDWEQMLQLNASQSPEAFELAVLKLLDWESSLV